MNRGVITSVIHERHAAGIAALAQRVGLAPHLGLYLEVCLGVSVVRGEVVLGIGGGNYRLRIVGRFLGRRFLGRIIGLRIIGELLAVCEGVL